MRKTRRTVRALAVALLALPAGLVIWLTPHAASAASRPPSFPFPEPPGDADQLALRRAIRGGELDVPHESPELAAMRRFEQEQMANLPRACDEHAQEPPGWNLTLPDLPVRFGPRVMRYLEFYRDDPRGRAIMTSWLRAEGRYRAMIEAAIARHKLPQALLYVSMIESGFDPLDRSYAGASGLWQFMPSTGRIYGLRIDHWVDERNDPEKATEAALRFLDDLRARFGSWEAALAAYNAGYGALLRAMDKYNTNDFWKLCALEDGMPLATSLYVPKIMAAAIVGENRAFFGYGAVSEDPPLRFDRVVVSASIALADAARAAGTTTDALAALNPELRRGRTPPGEWRLRLPPGSGERFLAEWPRYRETLASHTVRFGERLSGLATRYHTSTKRLRQLNGLHGASEVRPGVVLLVPSREEALAPVLVQADDDTPPTLVSVPDADAVEPGRRRLFYQVAAGDTLAEIAGYFEAKSEDVLRWNLLDGAAKLPAGLVLQLWVRPDFDAAPGSTPGVLAATQVRVVTAGSDEFLDEYEARRGQRRVLYTVRSGDTFKRIGARFGMSVGDIERVNHISRHEPTPGQQLVLYVPLRASDKRSRVGAPAPAPARATPDIAVAAAPVPTILSAPSKVATDDAPSLPLRYAPADDPGLQLASVATPTALAGQAEPRVTVEPTRGRKAPVVRHPSADRAVPTPKKSVEQRSVKRPDEPPSRKATRSASAKPAHTAARVKAKPEPRQASNEKAGHKKAGSEKASNKTSAHDPRGRKTPPRAAHHRR